MQTTSVFAMNITMAMMNILAIVTKIKKSGGLNQESNQQEVETPGLQVHTLTNNSQTAQISSV